MASTSAIGPVATAALAILQADAALLARVPASRILDDMPARPVYPYIIVESGGERAHDTMGDVHQPKWGSEATLRVRTISQFRGLAEITDIASLVKGALDGVTLIVDGYPHVSCDFTGATLLSDTVTGLVTRELLAEFSVLVHQ